jgi:hypothetical protein
VSEYRNCDHAMLDAYLLVLRDIAELAEATDPMVARQLHHAAARIARYLTEEEARTWMVG